MTQRIFILLVLTGGGLFPPTFAHGQATDGSMLLHISIDNPRYFAKADNTPVFVQGPYFRCELQDNCFNDPVAHPSNWNGVLADQIGRASCRERVEIAVA